MLVEIWRDVAYLSMGKTVNKNDVSGKKLRILVVQKAGMKTNMTFIN